MAGTYFDPWGTAVLRLLLQRLPRAPDKLDCPNTPTYRYNPVPRRNGRQHALEIEKRKAKEIKAKRKNPERHWKKLYGPSSCEESDIILAKDTARRVTALARADPTGRHTSVFDLPADGTWAAAVGRMRLR